MGSDPSDADSSLVIHVCDRIPYDAASGVESSRVVVSINCMVLASKLCVMLTYERYDFKWKLY